MDSNCLKSLYHFYMVSELWSPKQEIQKLKDSTILLVRESIQVRSMKEYLHCYEILDLTDTINQPWSQPGVVVGDLAAFVDLEITLKELILRQDPTGQKVKKYVLDMTRFLMYWKRSIDNKIHSKKLRLIGI